MNKQYTVGSLLKGAKPPKFKIDRTLTCLNEYGTDVLTDGQTYPDYRKALLFNIDMQLKDFIGVMI